MRKRTYKTLTSLTILSLLGQPIVGLAPHLVSAQTVDQSAVTETVTEKVNLALNKNVVATTRLKDAPAEKAVDGDDTSFWRSLTDDATPSLTVDLGDQHQIDELEVMLYMHPENDLMNEFKLEYSTDQLTWETAATQKENLNDKAIFNFVIDAEARFVRFTHDSELKNRNGLYELRVFGSELEPIETPEVEMGRNLALNRPTEHSTHWGSGGPSRNAVDENPDTFWRNLSSDGMKPWMIVDLGEEAVFDHVFLKVYTNPSGDHQMAAFNLEYSNDKETWYSIAEESGTENLQRGTEFLYNVAEETGEDYIHARYVRFTHELGKASQVNGLYELQVYEADVDVESVTINRNDFSLLTDTELQLRADVAPIFLEQSVTWTSSDPNVATVDENGTVRAVGIGQAVITATSTENNEKSDQVTVTVLAESLSDKELLSFDIGDYEGDIDQDSKVVTVEVPFETGLSSVVPTFTTNGVSVVLNGQTLTSGESAIDLSRPITLEVTGDDGIVNRYLVELIVQSSGQDIAYGKSITTDHYRADNPPELAVDGNPNTQFKSVIPMYNDGILDSYLQLDLGHKHTFDRVYMDFYNHFNIEEYRIKVSDDGENWTTVFEKTATLSPGDDNSIGDFEQFEEAVFEAPVTARYVRWEQLLVDDGDSLVGGMNDFAIYNGERNPIVEKAILMVDGEREVLPKEDIELPLGESLALSVRGILSNGEEVDIPAENIRLTARTRDGGPFHELGEDGTVTAIDYGITRVTAHIDYEGRTRTFDFFVDTFDYETVILDTAMEIAGSAALIGYPSVVDKGAAAPTLQVRPYFDGNLSVDVSLNGSSVYTDSKEVTGLEDVSLPLGVSTGQTGLYTVTLTLERDGKSPHVETFYFTVVDGNTKKSNETFLAYTGSDGKLVYTPDFRGNTLIDYSHAGYKGANEAVPEVAEVLSADKIKLVEPIEGDNTAHIQAAIDEVGSWELNEEGFRGVVQLAPGKFDIAGTLNMNKSGVILRGAGDEEGGTLLWDIGGNRNYMLTMGGGQTAETAVQSSVTDVP